MLHGLALVLRWSGRFDEELAAPAECTSITANPPGLAHLEILVLPARSVALAKSGRLDVACSSSHRRAGGATGQEACAQPATETTTCLHIYALAAGPRTHASAAMSYVPGTLLV